MQLPYSEELNIENFSRLFDNTSECYKFFWFKAIVGKVVEGKQEITYEELADEMIAEAWYMVTEYHLNLGPRDTLENLVQGRIWRMERAILPSLLLREQGWMLKK